MMVLAERLSIEQMGREKENFGSERKGFEKEQANRGHWIVLRD
jgi:hypothetical protein